MASFPEDNNSLPFINETQNFTSNETIQIGDGNDHLIGLILTGLLSVVLGLMILVTVIGEYHFYFIHFLLIFDKQHLVIYVE